MAETPTPGTYSIDPTHTEVSFVVRHMGLSKVRGGFTGVSGTIEVAENPTDSKVDVTIDAATFDSGAPDRDTHVKSPDFLDVETHPSLTFASKNIAASTNGWSLAGDLSIAGVTKPVVLDMEFTGMGVDPWGGTRAAYSAVTKINREDWGLTWNALLEGGGVLVGKEVTIELDVQTVKA
ncbi:MAG: YceI family protein [Acidimicrobiia bacterium]|nr:YceI family protein [Acidimicrobiia bacterium]